MGKKKIIFQNKPSFSWLTSRLFYWAGGDTQSICLFGYSFAIQIIFSWSFGYKNNNMQEEIKHILKKDSGNPKI